MTIGVPVSLVHRPPAAVFPVKQFVAAQAGRALGLHVLLDHLAVLAGEAPVLLANPSCCLDWTWSCLCCGLSG